MTSKIITDDEAAIYDRQIRVWGLDAQKRFEANVYSLVLCTDTHMTCYSSCRMRAANILVVGVDGMTGEVMKNIVLAGVNSVTLLDDREVRYCYALC